MFIGELSRAAACFRSCYYETSIMPCVRHVTTLMLYLSCNHHRVRLTSRDAILYVQ